MLTSHEDDVVALPETMEMIPARLPAVEPPWLLAGDARSILAVDILGSAVQPVLPATGLGLKDWMTL